MRFTDRYIATLKPKAKRHVVWEDSTHGLGSLGLRIFPNGKKSWVYLYGGRRRRFMTLGSYPVMNVATAHTKAVEIMADVERGDDPASSLKMDRATRRGALTLSELSAEYLERHAKPNKRTWKNDEYYLKRDVLPEYGTTIAADLRRRDMLLLIEGVKKRSPSQACHVLQIVRKMYNWGIVAELVAFNPCHLIPRPAKAKQRDRVLSEGEIRSLWRALEIGKVNGSAGQVDIPVSEPVRIGLRLALLTIVRRSELELAEWKEVDIESGWWTIPAERSKNGLQHRVPLNSMARGLLRQLHELTYDTGLLLPGRLPGYPVTLRCLTRALTRIRTLLGAEHYHLHDLRRTGATYMSRAGVPRFTIKKLLNHIDSDITAVYDRNSYDDDKWEAMLTWERALQSILVGKKSGRILTLPIPTHAAA